MPDCVCIERLVSCAIHANFLGEFDDLPFFFMLLLLYLFALLFYPIYFVYKLPALLIRYFERRWPDVLWRVHTKSKVVALTIDDGPSAFSQEIIDILRENNARW